ncbi:hypothetical protein ACR77J_12105 [Tissierella praeacuta]|uniref:hypothetical protein n=1 Tax=Tissierella praeacuta TaxID=43131 RepID=UPI0010486AFB|nr:hypothetical protein [Tissierella praeacuta]TCU72869.1 hypothetical protein EV204_105205 [Tissierella praeacuta]
MIILNPKEIIIKKIKKDYPNEKIKDYTYNNLERILIRNLKKNNKSELNEIRFDTDIRLQHIDITDFEKFISIRLSYYAVTLAILAIILSSQELLNGLSFDIKDFVYVIIIFMIIVIVSHNIIANKQKQELIYYRFKLKCIDKIIAEKENRKTK